MLAVQQSVCHHRERSWPLHCRSAGEPKMSLRALTRKRNLRTGAPVWSSERKPAVPQHRLTADLEADVLIVGAGISGALLAESLTEAGLSVVIVDRRSPLAGSTSASTALLQH